MTQEQLANLTHLDRSYLVGIEGGTRNPTLDVILKVARGLGVPPGELFG
jgi:transcriptional regulator with XRE-family HTH domain